MSIFITSDTHFGHDREFIFQPRGFRDIYSHDQNIIHNWNSVVGKNDTVYHLGDVMLGDNIHGLECLKQLNGQIHIIRGNHDTNPRLALYKECDNVVEVRDAAYLKYGKYHFFLTHYPCNSGSLEKDCLKGMTCNFFGHTHQQTNFYRDIPYMYHVGVDSHNCTPVNIDDAINYMKVKIEECKNFL